MDIGLPTIVKSLIDSYLSKSSFESIENILIRAKNLWLQIKLTKVRISIYEINYKFLSEEISKYM